MPKKRPVMNKRQQKKETDKRKKRQLRIVSDKKTRQQKVLRKKAGDAEIAADLLRIAPEFKITEALVHQHHVNIKPFNGPGRQIKPVLAAARANKLTRETEPIFRAVQQIADYFRLEVNSIGDMGLVNTGTGKRYAIHIMRKGQRQYKMLFTETDLLENFEEIVDAVKFLEGIE